ncbi:MAG: WD40/YVTN/BNR-like repeat-containing protein [Fimbriimonadaceae bacterium]
MLRLNSNSIRLLGLGLGVAGAAFGTAAQTQNPALFGGLRWRLVGPFRGGRALAVTGVPGSPEKFYFGSVGGGVWESNNAGRTWKSIFDNEPSTASIGWITVAPSDPNIIYVGAGEADMRSDIQQGDGVYVSRNGGKSWAHKGLKDTRQIGKIVVDPTDPNVAYVAALGHQYGPNEQRGVFKTTDGGNTWTKVLYKGPDVGAIDLAMDPSNSSVLYAAMWHTRRAPWSVYPPSEGVDSGLFKSSDAGATWSAVTGGGFPTKVWRIGVAICPSSPSRIYAFIDSPDPKAGGIYRSDDSGASWTHTDGEARVWGRGWYFAGITADPKDPDTVYVMNTSAYRSTDGGKTFIPFKGAPGGDDYHTLWIAPNDPDRMILGSDQGVVVSVDHGQSWSSWYNQPTGQFYHVITDNRFPYWIYGAQQDSGGMAVPSRTIHSGISSLDARPIDAGGESGTVAPDPLHPGLLYSSTGSKEDFATAWSQSIDPTAAYPDTHWRSEWTMPIAVSPADPHVFYTSHQCVFRTADGGATWKVISPDLTRKKNTNPSNLDAAGLADNEGLPRPGVVYWLAPSPVRARELWAGTDDGLLWLTQDDGGHWQDVTPPGFTSWTKIALIDASHFDAKTAYIAVDRHRLDDNRPYIYRTHDRGKHWRLITNGIPEGQFVNVVREDPNRAGLLYAGTDWGVYVSFDDGAHWQSLQLNLPTASVRDIAFCGNDIVVGTHGRAIWILDDAGLLRQLPVATANVHLFKPDPACLFQRAGVWGFGANDEGTPLPPEEPQGENPPWGAVFDYFLPAADGPVVISVKDASGRLIRRLSSMDKPAAIDVTKLDIPAYWVKPQPGLSAEAGAHRFVWDLRNGPGRGSRRRGGGGVLVPPGRYTVTLTAGGHTSTQTLTVVRDPRVPATDADLNAQYKFALAIAAEADAVRAAMRSAAGTAMTQPAATRLKMQALASGGSHSLQAVVGRLGALQGAVESAPAAPNVGAKQAFAALKQLADEDLVKLRRLRGA